MRTCVFVVWLFGTILDARFFFKSGLVFADKLARIVVLPIWDFGEVVRELPPETALLR